MQRYKHWTHVEEATAKSLYEEGFSIIEIARRLGVHHHRVARKLHTMGIKDILVRGWTEEELAELRVLANKGLTMRELSAALNKTKGSVAGQLARLGIKKEKHRDTPLPYYADASSVIIDDDSCQYPHGHPTDPDFYYCGNPVVANKPYCMEHCKVCYEKTDVPIDL